jgi:CheY-like chemotaxis protein
MFKYNVVLVEDNLEMGELLSEVLSRHGSVQVSWYVRARRQADSDELIFMDAAGMENAFDSDHCHLAFVDWQLKMSSLTGLEVTRELAGRGVKVVASSGDSHLNAQMVKAGARIGLAKDRLFSRAIDEFDLVEKLLAELH